MKYIYGLIAGLVAIIYYLMRKKGVLETLNKTFEQQKDSLQLDKEIVINDGKEVVEEQKRDALKENLKKEETKNVSQDDLVKFLNSFNKPK